MAAAGAAAVGLPLRRLRRHDARGATAGRCRTPTSARHGLPRAASTGERRPAARGLALPAFAPRPGRRATSRRRPSSRTASSTSRTCGAPSSRSTARTGTLLWRRAVRVRERTRVRTGSPSTTAGSTARRTTNAFALSAANRQGALAAASSRPPASRSSTSRRRSSGGLVYTSTVGCRPWTWGALRARRRDRRRALEVLDDRGAAGAVPAEAGGGGAWYPLERRRTARLFCGEREPDTRTAARRSIRTAAPTPAPRSTPIR